MDKIKTLSIDLETFSDVDLAKCGVYRYVESPAFEILLFGVSVNGGDVVVYDLAQGEKIPAEILTDTSVIKRAFNATFERVCLSKYLGLPSGEYLDPTSWRCSMIWSAYMGLPLSLAGAGAVLGLSEQKLKEGKDLAVITLGPIGNVAARAIERAEKDKGISIAHYDLRFLKPLDEALLHEVGLNFQHVVTIEDGVKKGGMGSAILEFMADNDYIPHFRRIGVPDAFIEHGTIQELHHLCGMDEEGIYNQLIIDS